jgi:sugar lactone lactonase YvrE
MYAVFASTLSISVRFPKGNTMTREFRMVVGGQSFAEGPRWHGDRLFFSDLYTHRVLSVREDGSDLRTEAEVDDQTS